MPGRMDAAQASPMSARMAVSREQTDHPLMLGLMNELDAGKLDGVRSLPAGPPAKDGLARIVDADGGDDDARNSYYETPRIPPLSRSKPLGVAFVASTLGG